MNWISVKDKLPQDRATILFCTKDVMAPTMFPLQGYYHITDQVWVGYLWSQRRTDVTHWMPMPKPPSR